MTDDQLTNLTDEQKESVSAARSEFLEKLRLNEKTSIEQQLALVDSAMRPHLMRVLLTAEVEYRQSAGQSLGTSEYKARFPDDAQLIDDVFTVQVPAAAQETVSIPGQKLPPGSESVSSVQKTQKDNESSDEFPQSFGRYELRRMLGRGGMGSVYLAHDQELDRDVAIKFPIFDDQPDRRADSIERFRREARAMATLRHPNLCPVYDVGEHDGRHFLTMAYIQGKTLAGGRLAQDDVIRIGAVIADAVQAAHEAGIVHRDLKPANVMIDSRGEPVIMDFGLALRQAATESELTRTGTVIGSPAYMAPEQVNAQHDQIGPKTDVYAIGVLLYRLLTGKVPFDGPGLSVLGEISSGKLPKPPSEIVSVDERLESVCLTAMAHRPDDRYSTAEELADALRCCVSNEAPTIVLSEPIGSKGGGRAFAERPQRSVAAVAAVSLAVVIGIAMFFGPTSENQGDELGAGARGIAAGTDSLNGSMPQAVGDDAVEISEVSAADRFTSRDYRWTLPEPVIVGDAQVITRASTPFVPEGERKLYFADYSRGLIAITTRYGATDPWNIPVSFDTLAATSRNDGSPTLTLDQKTIVFASQREGGQGDFDLWMATRSRASDSFGAPINLGQEVNSSGDDGSGTLSRNGLKLYFHSDRRGGYGRRDLWVTSRSSVNDRFGAPENVGPEINSKEDDYFPALTPDGTALVYSRFGGGLRISTREESAVEFTSSAELPGFPDESQQLPLSVLNDAVYFCPDIGPNRQEVRVTRRVAKNVSPDVPQDSAAWKLLSDDYRWSSLERIAFEEVTSVYAPFLSDDGNQLFLTRWLPETDSFDLVVSKREGDGWLEPKSLLPINSTSRDFKASTTGDGLTVVFGSNREGGHGASDLWMAQRASGSDEFGEAVNLGRTINTSSDEGRPHISKDGLKIVFDSNRHDASSDILVSRRSSTDEPFGPPESIGAAVNSGLDETMPSLSDDGTAMVFSRYSRLYLATRRSEEEPFTTIQLPRFSGARQTINPHLSSDGSELYFIVHDYNGDGDRELWVTRRERR
jgi:Tol biopolymer transport system component/predicted Ser/Thr protein kinase